MIKKPGDWSAPPSSDSPGKGLGERLQDWVRGGFSRPTLFTGIVTLVVVGTAFVYLTCTKYVRPDEWGVMQVDVGMGGMFGPRGIHTNLYGPGLHWQIPSFQKIHTFPRCVQVLTLKAQLSEQNDYTSKFTRETGPVHIQTSDGFYIDLDVSILYRIENPYLTITRLGAGKLYEDNGIIPKAEPTLKEIMGTLNPEDFFNSQLRVQKQEEARVALNRILSDKGINVEHVLVRYPKYHPAIQERIEGKNIQEQARFANIAKAAQSAAEAELKKVVQEGQAAVSIRLMTGSNYVTRKVAAMQSYQTMKQSDADTLVQKAEARKTELMNQAYQGVGSERVVAMEMAEVLNGLQYILVPAGGQNGFNPLDLDAVARAFQAQPPKGGTNQ